MEMFLRPKELNEFAKQFLISTACGIKNSKKGHLNESAEYK